MRAAGGDTGPPDAQVPRDGTLESREDHARANHPRINDASADRLGDMQAEEQESDEVEEGSPKDGRAGRQNARRHDRGNRIGGVMQPVEEVENEGEGDEAN